MNESPSQSPLSGTSEPKPDRVTKFHFWKWFWLTFLVVSLAYAWYCFYVPSNNIVWADNYDLAQKQASDSGKPIILYFTGKWCVPCRIMKRQVWADEEVAASVNGQFLTVAIDVDDPDNAAVLARYKVSGAPVTIITDPKGNVLGWRSGGISKAEFIEFLREPNPPPAKGL